MTGSAAGLLIGLAFGIGALLVLASFDGAARVHTRSRRDGRLERRLADAGVTGIGPRGFVAVCGLVGVGVFVVVAATSGSAVIAAVFGAGALAAPFLLLGRRARQRRAELRVVWPDVVDDLASAVRAGLSLPEALAQIGEHGPPAVAPAFARFAADYRASGRFVECLDLLADRLGDPVSDRLVAALRLAREVGGSDLGRVLRALSSFLREDARTRGELEARQSWTVNAARLAVAAPWVTLGFLALRPEAVAAYDTGAGAVVLLSGAVLSVVAYRLMLSLGRLPSEPRVLR